MGAELWVGSSFGTEQSSKKGGFELKGFPRGRRGWGVVRAAPEQEGSGGQWV